MKFQNILLFFAAASFALANSLEVSEDESVDLIQTDDDDGVKSDKELVDTPADDASSTPSNPADEEATTDKIPIDEAKTDKKEESTVDKTPSDEGTTTSSKTEEGEASDDYDEGKASSVAAADGEASDDYGNEESTDGATVNDLDTKEDELSENDDDMSTETKVAAGLAGAAALSSAGVFLWVKRSKKSKIENIV